MRGKVLIICLVSFIIGLIISCYNNSTLYVYYDTKVDSTRVLNAKFNNNYYKGFRGDTIQSEKFSLIVKCYLKDSFLNSKNHIASIKRFSFFQDAYCSNITGETINFNLTDNISNLNIFSLFDFNDNLKAHSDLLNCFNIGYHTFYAWNDTIDSIKGIKQLGDLRLINGLITNTDRHFDNLALFLKLNIKPKYDKQRFVINFKFQSGKILSDTTKLIYIE
jgi:hypothetical protein